MHPLWRRPASWRPPQYYSRSACSLVAGLDGEEFVEFVGAVQARSPIAAGKAGKQGMYGGQQQPGCRGGNTPQVAPGEPLLLLLLRGQQAFGSPAAQITHAGA